MRKLLSLIIGIGLMTSSLVHAEKLTPSLRELIDGKIKIMVISRQPQIVMNSIFDYLKDADPNYEIETQQSNIVNIWVFVIEDWADVHDLPGQNILADMFSMAENFANNTEQNVVSYTSRITFSDGGMKDVLILNIGSMHRPSIDCVGHPIVEFISVGEIDGKSLVDIGC